MTQKGLLAISQHIRQHFAPKLAMGQVSGVGTRLLAHRLRDISQDIRLRFPISNKTATGTGTQPVCVALPVDPAHLHVYWRTQKTASAQPLVIELTSVSPAGFVSVYYRPAASQLGRRRMTLEIPQAIVFSTHQVSVGGFDETGRFQAVVVSAPCQMTISPARLSSPDKKMKTFNDSGVGR